MHGVPHFLPSRPRSARNDHRRIGRFTQEYHASVTTGGRNLAYILLQALPTRLLREESLDKPAGIGFHEGRENVPSLPPEHVSPH